jgi:hypothetical protein
MQPPINPFVESEGVPLQSQSSMHPYKSSMPNGLKQWFAVFGVDEFKGVLGQQLLVTVIEVTGKDVVIVL